MNSSPHTVLYDTEKHVFAKIGIRPSTVHWNELLFKTKAAFENHDFSICAKPSIGLGIRAIKANKIPVYLSKEIHDGAVISTFNIDKLYYLLRDELDLFPYFRISKDGTDLLFEDFEVCYGRRTINWTVNGYIPEYQWYSTGAVFELLIKNLCNCDVELLSNSIRISSKSPNQQFVAYVLAQRGSI